MTNKNIGITGASGVIGTILQEKLTNAGFNFSCFNGDITKKEDVKSWVSKEKPTYIFHLAAMVPTIQVKENPLLAYDVNVSGTINLLSEVIKSKEKIWLFYAGTAHVYKSSDKPIKETDAIEPVSLYGKTKYFGEDICIEASKIENYNLDVCIGRIFSFYHKSQKPPFLYPTMLERLQKEDLTKPFFLYGADSERDFLNAEDICDIMIKAMEKRLCGIFNIASGKGIKIRDFVQNLTDTKLNIETNNEKDFLIANTDKLKSALGEQNDK